MPRTVWCHTVFTSSSFYILHFSVFLLLLLLFDISIKQGSWHFYGWQVDEEKKKSKKKKKSYPCHLVSRSFLRVLVQMCPGTSLMWLFMFMFVCLFAYLFSGKKKKHSRSHFRFSCFFPLNGGKTQKKKKKEFVASCCIKKKTAEHVWSFRFNCRLVDQATTVEPNLRKGAKQIKREQCSFFLFFFSPVPVCDVQW